MIQDSDLQLSANLLKKRLNEAADYENTNVDSILTNKTVPLDMFLLRYTCQNESHQQVRLQAIKLLMGNFS